MLVFLASTGRGIWDLNLGLFDNSAWQFVCLVHG